jgi:outer membrane protein
MEHSVKPLMHLIALVALALALPVQAATGVKVGYVNIATVMEQAPQAETARKALQKEFSSREARLTAERDAIIELEKKLKTDGEVMSESKRSALEREILKRKRSFNRAQDEFKEDLNLRRNEELAKIQKQVFESIVTLGKQDSYDLIVTERVLYASERIDITDKVLKELKRSKR